jgi:hypothetical protein
MLLRNDEGKDGFPFAWPAQDDNLI